MAVPQCQQGSADAIQDLDALSLKTFPLPAEGSVEDAGVEGGCHGLSQCIARVPKSSREEKIPLPTPEW